MTTESKAKSKTKSKSKSKSKAKAPVQNGYKARLKVRYEEEIVSALLQEFGYSNRMQAPKLEKVVLNIGMGEALQNAKAIEAATNDLETISGQHPVTTKARKSVANFKVREGNIVGLMLTLRGARMYEFLDRLINAGLPRIRDFRGVSSTAFDGRGNYSLGLRDQTMFPEIDYGQLDRLRGLQITIVTSAKTDDEARSLLTHFGMPFTRTG
jgi:large subunit ribosomal protein L5